jgi:Uncharacterized conserved protein
MQIKIEDYPICYDRTTATVSFAGSLRLTGSTEYVPIAHLRGSVVYRSPGTIILNLQQLECLNSSRISMLSKLNIGVRKQGRVLMAMGLNPSLGQVNL